MNLCANIKSFWIHGDCVLQGIESAIKMPMHQKTDVTVFKFGTIKNPCHTEFDNLHRQPSLS